MKILRELRQNKADCKLIFEFITGRIFEKKYLTKKYILLYGESHTIRIYYDGHITNADWFLKSNTFKTVDFIRSLGYEPEITTK